MLIFRFILIFGARSRIGLHIKKNEYTHFSHVVHCFSISIVWSETSCFCSVFSESFTWTLLKRQMQPIRGRVVQVMPNEVV